MLPVNSIIRNLFGMARAFNIPGPNYMIGTRFLNEAILLDKSKEKSDNSQMEIISNIVDKETYNWAKFKTEILAVPDPKPVLNPINFEGLLLKSLVRARKYQAASSFAKHVLTSANEVNLGTMNGILSLYYELEKAGKLTDSEKKWILNTYKNLKNKYKVLDSVTNENLIKALCIIGEWKIALELLVDLNFSCTPSHAVYSSIIAALFEQNKKTEAMKYITISINDNRQLQDIAYEAWIRYILRKYKTKDTIIKYLEEICLHLSGNFVTLNEGMATKLKETFEKYGWKGELSRVDKSIGECSSCRSNLEGLSLTEEEFILLQKNVQEKTIVGSDVFLKTSPKELKNFQTFLEKTLPFDVVLDALNIGFAIGSETHPIEKANFIVSVVKYFKERNKKILFLGRKHMLRWPKIPMSYILKNCYNFFTDDISQDDPFFITAAVLSGPETDIVSKDLLRGHRFKLQDERVRLLFQRWQWQHQWVVTSRKRKPVITPPLKFTPCAQKKNGCWHLLYQRDDFERFGQIHDGLPKISTWLCLKPKAKT